MGVRVFVFDRNTSNLVTPSQQFSSKLTNTHYPWSTAWALTCRQPATFPVQIQPPRQSPISIPTSATTTSPSQLQQEHRLRKMERAISSSLCTTSIASVYTLTPQLHQQSPDFLPSTEVKNFLHAFTAAIHYITHTTFLLPNFKMLLLQRPGYRSSNGVSHTVFLTTDSIGVRSDVHSDDSMGCDRMDTKGWEAM